MLYVGLALSPDQGRAEGELMPQSRGSEQRGAWEPRTHRRSSLRPWYTRRGRACKTAVPCLQGDGRGLSPPARGRVSRRPPLLWARFLPLRQNICVPSDVGHLQHPERTSAALVQGSEQGEAEAAPTVALSLSLLLLLLKQIHVASRAYPRSSQCQRWPAACAPERAGVWAC